MDHREVLLAYDAVVGNVGEDGAEPLARALDDWAEKVVKGSDGGGLLVVMSALLAHGWTRDEAHQQIDVQVGAELVDAVYWLDGRMRLLVQL